MGLQMSRVWILENFVIAGTFTCTCIHDSWNFGKPPQRSRQGRIAWLGSIYGFWIQTVLKSYLDHNHFVKLLNRSFLSQGLALSCPILEICKWWIEGSNVKENRPFQLVHFVFPFQTMWCSQEFSFCLFISYAYICTCIRWHLKETILWSSITWSEMGKQNVRAEKVY